ncbi:MAG: hypothetical protein KDA99_21945, partial [Planctomycetales bacterium]|nr:hypothetical protein [Planctomycetales bacterium]
MQNNTQSRFGNSAGLEYSAVPVVHWATPAYVRNKLNSRQFSTPHNQNQRRFHFTGVCKIHSS